MNLKELAQTVSAVAGACAVLGSIVYATGWVVSEARSSEIAQQKANVVAEQLYVMARDREEAQITSELQTLLFFIQILESKPEKTDFDRTQIDLLKGQMNRKQVRLAEIAAEKLKVPVVK